MFRHTLLAICLTVACLGIAPVRAADADSNQEHKPDPQNGKRIYDQMCAGCHGFRGDGGEGHRGGFSPHVPTLANKEYMNSVPDDYLFLIIQKGGAYMGKMATMPAWEKRLSEQEILDIVAHLRTF
ncbi:MAG TPA: cytochrome c [Burkholderiales bacterium]|nr:cytochrome c [Burkholderiales bacterium]